MFERAGRLRRSGAVTAALWLALAGRGLAIDMRLPARIRVRVADEAGQPVRGARVTVWSSPDAYWAVRRLAERETDAKGIAAFEIGPPGKLQTLDDEGPATLMVERDGFLSERRRLSVFPDARLEPRVVLERKRRTTIRVLGPDGKGLADMRMVVDFTSARTNARGEHVHVHGRLPDGLQIGIGSRTFVLADEREVELRLKREEIPAPQAARRLEGRLVTEDGPADGWLIARGSRWAGGIGTNHRMTDTYRAKALERLGPAGAFAVDRAGDHVLFVSPQGIPFLFPLEPETWPPGPRRVEVRVPRIRRRHRGRLVWAGGAAAAGVGIAVCDVRSQSRDYKLEIGTTRWDSRPPWRVRATDGSPVGTFVTDREGRYALPVHVGADVDFRLLVNYGTRSGGLMREAKVVLEPRKREPPRPTKRILLVFSRESGEPLADMRGVSYETAEHRKEPASLSDIRVLGFASYDVRGAHVFLEPGTRRVDVAIRSTNWRPLERSLDVSGPQDRTVRIAMPDALRLRPLAGTVRDPDGKPVARVGVSLYTVSEDLDDDPQYLGFNTTTDAEGRFAFEAAPDACFIHLSRWAADGNTWDLPGWSGPVPVTKEPRAMTVRLKRPGSVRLLLPDGPLPPTHSFGLERSKREGPHPQPHDTYSLATDGRTLYAPSVAPGRYGMVNYDSSPHQDLRGMADVDVTVEPGTETTVDLRQSTLFPLATLPTAWIELTIRGDGKPLSGATVTILTRAPGEDRPEVVAADLSDVGGRVRFRALVGRRYVAVARMPGRRIGWRGFTAERPATLEVETTRSRTLVVRLNRLELPPKQRDGRSVWARVPGASVDEAAALFDMLGLFAHQPPTDRFAQLRRGGERVFVAEDLPVRATVTLQVRRWDDKVAVERSVTVADDERPEQHVPLHTP